LRAVVLYTEELEAEAVAFLEHLACRWVSEFWQVCLNHYTAEDDILIELQYEAIELRINPESSPSEVKRWTEAGWDL
jgi:hypothetical protein